MTPAIISLPLLTDEERWAAVMRRAKEMDETFYFSVETTGVYCRPSCAARRPLRENVCFHASCEAAEAAGFRPCKRCRPNEASLAAERTRAIEQACRAIESAEESPDINDVAEAAGMSRFHFQRVFKQVTGVTPHAYFEECRMRRTQAKLARSKTVTEAIYDAGFNSSGRFYTSAAQRLGMQPRIFRAGGKSTTIRFAVAACSLGSILVAATDAGICSISLGDEPERLVADLQRRFSQANIIVGGKEFESWVAGVIGLVENPRHEFDLPLDIRGTAFQQRVWRALRDIPIGSTASYEAIAERIGSPSAVRAVAGACASNAIAVAIPCHRVVRKDGGLSGYRWGVKRKRALIEREAKPVTV